MPNWTAVIALVLALLLDRWLAEPPARWHPVGWMSRYLGWIGGLIAPRSSEPSPNWSAFAAGALAWYGGAMAAALLAWVVQWWVLSLHPVLGAAVLGLLLKPMLAWRVPRDEVRDVDIALGQSLAAGRRQLGRLVNRPVMRLDEAQVRQSAIESLAGNFNASLVAPVFWFVLAGLPGAVVYRFAHTADALWGYRGFRAGVHWEWAGKWAARADDVLSWVPARFSALLIALAAGGLSPGELRREAAQAPSPNSGWPLAAMALALGVQLQKPGAYTVNAQAAAPALADTQRAIRLAQRAFICLALWALGMLWLLAWSRA